MALLHFTVDGEQPVGIEAKTEIGYVALLYTGDLGGGTLRVYTTIEGHKAPIPNSKLSAATLDGNGDAIQIMMFSTAGTLSVALTGATAPDVYVGIK